MPRPGARAIFARLALVAAVALVAVLVTSKLPREVQVVYDLASRAPVSVLDVEMWRGGERVRRTEFRWNEPQLRAQHTVRLAPGEYELRFRMITADGATIESRGLFTVDGDAEGSVVHP